MSSSIDNPMINPVPDIMTTSRDQSPISIPQKRTLEDDHQPPISSPLNPDFTKSNDEAPVARERAARAKKESFKKRESKGPLAPESRATPDPKSPSKHKRSSSFLAPLRYKLPPPRLADFEAPQGPTFTPHHTIKAPDGSDIQFHETSDQYDHHHCG